MNFKLNFPLQLVRWQQFFVEGYIASLLVLLIGIIIFSALTFYETLNQGAAGSDTEPPASFDVSAVLKVNELLDIRAEYFNHLRATESSLKDLF